MSHPLYFYLPPHQWPSDWPQSPDDNWPGFGLGIFAWTLQTYLRLSAAGVPCHLVDHVPETGIVMAHSNSLRGGHLRPRPGQALFLVCLKAEAPYCADAQLHVVQNRLEANQRDRIFLPHWPQPGLRQRQPERGDRFENIAFLGHRDSLAPELHAPELQKSDWHDFLAGLGLRWQPVINTHHWANYHHLDARWHDYHHLDAVVAVRRFNRVDHAARSGRQPYPHKPATKLYNAWLAGVPAILGPESAFRSERQHPLDYLEVHSLAQLKTAILTLKGDASLRRAMVAQGRQRAQTIAPAQITSQWLAFLQSVVFPAYDRWCAQPRWRHHLRLQQGAWRTLVDKTQRKFLY